MTLKEYLKEKDREDFALKIGTTKNYLNLLACGSRRPSPELALKIEQATGKQVTRLELLYPDSDADPDSPIPKNSGGEESASRDSEGADR